MAGASDSLVQLEGHATPEFRCNHQIAVSCIGFVIHSEIAPARHKTGSHRVESVVRYTLHRITRYV